MQARQGRDAKEKVAESAQDYNGNGVLFQLYHPRTIFRSNTQQQQQQQQSWLPSVAQD
jgi:hypothetical protein